jgi:hypothetical protein
MLALKGRSIRYKRKRGFGAPDFFLKLVSFDLTSSGLQLSCVVLNDLSKIGMFLQVASRYGRRLS